MIKKPGAQKTSGKMPKKILKKKVAEVPASPEKPPTKKRTTGKVVSGAKLRKTPAVKKTPKGQVQKKKVPRPKKTTTQKEPPPTKAAPKRALKKTPAKVTRKTAKKAESPPKAEKPRKTIRIESRRKGAEKAKIKGIKKTRKRVAERPQKKVSAKKTKKAETPVPRKLPPKKLITARAKKRETGKDKEPESIAELKAVRKEIPREKPAIKKSKLLKETIKEEKKVTASDEIKKIEAGTLPTDYGTAEVTFPPTPLETLPSEYGENSITLMTVNPYRIFCFWEAKEETLKIWDGILNLRVYDVTGIDIDASDAYSYIDVSVSERIGEIYLDVSPGKDYVADIGILYNGIFIGIARSPKVSTPRAGVPGEEEFLPEGLDTGIRKGY